MIQKNASVCYFLKSTCCFNRSAVELKYVITFYIAHRRTSFPFLTFSFFLFFPPITHPHLSPFFTHWTAAVGIIIRVAPPVLERDRSDVVELHVQVAAAVLRLEEAAAVLKLEVTVMGLES